MVASVPSREQIDIVSKGLQGSTVRRSVVTHRGALCYGVTATQTPGRHFPQHEAGRGGDQAKRYYRSSAQSPDAAYR